MATRAEITSIEEGSDNVEMLDVFSLNNQNDETVEIFLHDDSNNDDDDDDDIEEKCDTNSQNSTQHRTVTLRKKQETKSQEPCTNNSNNTKKSTYSSRRKYRIGSNAHTRTGSLSYYSTPQKNNSRSFRSCYQRHPFWVKISNINPFGDEQCVFDLVKPYGNIKCVAIDLLKCYAIVAFAKLDDARKAKEILKNTKMGGHVINVTIIGVNEKYERDLLDHNSKKMYRGHLPSGVYSHSGSSKTSNNQRFWQPNQ